ncbi:MAG: histidine kinase [Lachnospiraceae bacterium]
MSKKKRSLSLNKKIALIPCSVFIPMLLVVMYLLATLLSSTKDYSAITESVTYANQYSQEFKERMDYSMYLAVIGNKTLSELGDGETTINGIITVNPYEYIEELSSVCIDLSNMATAPINKTKITRVENSLKSLTKRVATLEKMISGGSSYDAKIDYLEENIRGQSGLTTIIQGALQEYIFRETKNFAQVKQALQEQTRHAIELSVIALAGTVIISLVLSGLATRSVTRPIRNLCSQTRKVAQGDFTAKSTMESIDEISVLTQSFNDMTAKIGVLVDNIKQQEKTLRMAESKLLQAQINPHFLYNTLDTIVWLAEEKKSTEVISVVTALSEFFRTTLSKGKDQITLEEEKSHIESYLKIQQFRYQDILEYKMNLPESLYRYIIPKLTLQPLVENALYHGIKKQRGKGFIHINGWEEDGYIHLVVSDNGVGISTKKLQHLRNSILQMDAAAKDRSFGLANVNQRIRYYYGEACGVFLESREGEGTNVTVLLQAKNNLHFS